LPELLFHLVLISAQTDQTVQDLNLAFCELASLSILSNCPKLLKGKARGSNKNVTRQIQAATVLPIDRVNEYVAQLLQGGLVSSNGLSRLTPVGSYTALLPTIWSLINSPGSETSGNDVLVHVIDHAIRIPSSSAVKKVTIEFIGRLILVRHFFYSRMNN
jgi:pre-rRNA-processing protein IPI1